MKLTLYFNLVSALTAATMIARMWRGAACRKNVDALSGNVAKLNNREHFEFNIKLMVIQVNHLAQFDVEHRPRIEWTISLPSWTRCPMYRPQ